MERRPAALVCLLILFSSLPYSHASLAASVFSQPASVELGFNPSSMLPVSDGVPIFTQGDDVWVV